MSALLLHAVCFLLRGAAQQHSTIIYTQSSPQKSASTAPEETHLGQLQAARKTVTGTSWSLLPLKLRDISPRGQSVFPRSQGIGEFISGTSDVNPILCLDSGAIFALSVAFQ